MAGTRKARVPMMDHIPDCRQAVTMTESISIKSGS